MKQSPILRTFAQWNAMGYNVAKGSKATWVDGVALFTDGQVSQKRSGPPYRDSWDGADDLNCAGGPMYGIYGNCE